MAEMLSALPGVHPLAPVLRAIIGLHDSLQLASTPSERARLYTELATIYARLDMTEDAITFGREALEAVPGDLSSTLLVADLYAGKKRFMAARRLLEAAWTSSPDDVRLSQRLGSLPPP
jgi:Flp pilus assembly protein TadD